MSSFFSKLCLFAFSIFIVFTSCDDEVSNVNGDLLPSISINNYNENAVSAKQVSTVSVQANNLSSHLLGTHKDSKLGNTTYSILTEISPTEDTSLPKDEDIKEFSITKVELILPYISTLQGTSDGKSTYIVTGTSGDNIKLNVFKTNEILRINNVDVPNEFQRYYANQNFSSLTDTSIIDSAVEIKTPDNNARVIINEKDKRPALRIPLDLTEFENFKASNNKLSSFRDFKLFTTAFKSLYINPEAENEGLTALQLNSSGGFNPRIEITFSITTKEVPAEGDTPKKEEETIEKVAEFKISNPNSENRQVVNLVKSENGNQEITENIVLKGGASSIGSIKLFDNNIGSEFETLYNNDVLINSAILTLTVNEELSPELDQLPTFLFLHELTENTDNELFPRVLIDYTNNQNNAILLASNHLIPLQEINEKRVYQFNVTEHVQRILNRPDFTEAKKANTTLYFGSTENILNDSFLPILKESSPQEFANIGSILTPKGVVIHGTNSSSTENRPQLNIKYTFTK